VDVLVVAAEAREFAGLLSRVKHKQKLKGLGLACAWQVSHGEQDWTLVADGAGAELARQATEVALSQMRPRAILNIGLCGALRPGLSAGTLLWAGAIEQADGEVIECETPAGGDSVRLLSLNRVAVTAAEKRKLAERSGAEVVEMEAAGVAAAARAVRVPFYCLRVVSDEAEEDLPLDFNDYRDAEGRFSRGRVAAACLFRPWVIPSLMGFNRRCLEGAEKLGEYLVDVRFA
jgi:nucleoside phosphorylase